MLNQKKDLLTGKAYNIEIYSFSNEKFLPITNEGITGSAIDTITFPAFITDFNDSYRSEWTPHQVLGKMDPIVTFKNTKRTINLSFDVPNADIVEAQQSLAKIDYFIRGLYPVYYGNYGTAVMASPPIYRVRFANLIRNAASDVEGEMSESNLVGGSTLRTGLMCYFNSFDFKPKVDSGFFVSSNKNSLYPKMISVSLSMNIIHEHPLGKQITSSGVKNRDGFNAFPRFDPKYKKKTENPPPGSGTEAESTQKQIAEDDILS